MRVCPQKEGLVDACLLCKVSFLLQCHETSAIARAAATTTTTIAVAFSKMISLPFGSSLSVICYFVVCLPQFRFILFCFAPVPGPTHIATTALRVCNSADHSVVLCPCRSTRIPLTWLDHFPKRATPMHSPTIAAFSGSFLRWSKALEAASD